VLEWLFGVFVTVRKEIIIIHVIILAIRDIQKKNYVNYANFFPIIPVVSDLKIRLNGNGFLLTRISSNYP